MNSDVSLNILILVPLIGSLLIPLCKPGAARPIAIWLSWVLVAIAGYLAVNFNLQYQGMQFEQQTNWFRTPFPVSYHVGIDGMSLCLVMLTALVTVASVYASKAIGANRSKLYYSLVMLLTASIIGTFVSLDLLQFFVFFELELVPMYFLIAIWGGANRAYAAMKFLLYTFTGGVFMLASLLYLYFHLGATGSARTLDMVQLATQAPMLAPSIQAIACLGFLLAFCIKLPSFPFHTWLPDAHVEAPTPISMILAGLLLKMGSYGLVRICLGFFPDVIATWGWFLVALGCFNVVWAAIACLVQSDMKRVIAFSSVSHMGFILIGLGSLSAAALSGAIFQMISHGFISAALFFLVGVVYERTHTRIIPEIGGGLANEMPTTFYFWLLAALANLGLPALAGFVAEATVFYGAFNSPTAAADPTFVRGWLIVAGTGVILSAGYMLWLLQRTLYGPINEKWAHHLTDMTGNEKFVGVLLSVFIVALGVYPLMITQTWNDMATKMVSNATTRNNVSMRSEALFQ
jgi:NADH-quinone oxidoreductase subunit M